VHSNFLQANAVSGGEWCVQMSIHNHNHNPFQLLSFLLSLYLLLLTTNTSFFALTSVCRGYKGHTHVHALHPPLTTRSFLCADYQKGNFQRGKFPLLLPFAPAFKKEEMEISQSLAPALELESDPIRVWQNRSCWQTLFVRIRFLDAMSPCFNSPRFSIVFILYLIHHVYHDLHVGNRGV